MSLLVLAAGMGSRYKGQKQADGVSEHGETLMEFALYDAVKAGVEKVVFIINDQFEEEFKNRLEENLRKKNCEVHFVIQTKEKYIPKEYLPKVESRTKPLGTAHAVLCAKEVISEPFMTINADDFYGRNTYEIAVEAVNSGKINSRNYAMMGFRLKNTLSKNGPVSRGICQVENQKLTEIKEFSGIQKMDGIVSGLNEEGQKETLDENNLISMNFWVLDSSFMDLAEKELIHFLERLEPGSNEEFYLPKTVDTALRKNIAQVSVLPTNAHWFGLTFPDDKELVVKSIADLKAKEVYPNKLWD